MNHTGFLTGVAIAAVLMFVASGTACAATAAVAPGDFTYLGAFRLPGDGERPETFGYGGNAMTFNPAGDPSGGGDGFPGSLFIMGHERLPYGELPNGNQIAEVSIPRPVASKSPGALPRAEFLQPFRDAARGLFTEYCEIPRIGMELITEPATGPKIHLAWGQHFHEDASAQRPHMRGSTRPVQSESKARGTSATILVQASTAISSRSRKTGPMRTRRAPHRQRDATATAAVRPGTCLFAYLPWIGDDGSPAAPGTRLKETTLLLYRNSRESEDVVNLAMRGYQHADEWEGGAWLTTSTGKSAVLFAGTKGVGAKYWYGWVNPAGSESPCVETEFVGQFNVCRAADGAPCAGADLEGCANHNDFRGWWSSRMEAQFILYNPDDLARVASGEAKPWEPQPYAHVTVDDRLLLNPGRVEEDMLGTGVKRRFRISAVAYDRIHDLLYVLEPFADDTKPVVHVGRVQ